MKVLKVRAGALVTATGLVLIGVGAATTQASATGQSSSSERSCESSHERGDVWQHSKPAGDDWEREGTDEQFKYHRMGADSHEDYKGGEYVSDAPDGWTKKGEEGHGEDADKWQYEKVSHGSEEHSGWVTEKPHADEGEHEWVKDDDEGRKHYTRDKEECERAKPTVTKTVTATKTVVVSGPTQTVTQTVTQPAVTVTAAGPTVTETVTATSTVTVTETATPAVVVSGTGTSAPPPPAPPAKTVTIVQPPVQVAGVSAAVNPLPAAASAGQADTSGQVAAGGFAGLAGLLMLMAGFVMRRRRGEV